eukprot:scaffold2232_cov365-Prasinococcus_capsulatus_cf.AAC.6
MRGSNQAQVQRGVPDRTDYSTCSSVTPNMAAVATSTVAPLPSGSATALRRAASVRSVVSSAKLVAPLRLPTRWTSNVCTTSSTVSASKPIVASLKEEAVTEGRLDTALKNFFLSAAVSTTPLLLLAGDALAEDEPHNILKGTSIALIHPIVMGILFATTLYSGYLGLQWRRTRTIGDEIKAAKAAVPVGPDGAQIDTAPEALKVKELTQERSELLAGNFRDKHFLTSSILLGFGIFITVEGCLNTYTRTGKLFPGPHLYAGAAICCLWAFGAALVPAMQKGNDTARSLHIALATINVGLFVWQIPTGLEIVGKAHAEHCHSVRSDALRIEFAIAQSKCDTAAHGNFGVQTAGSSM